MNHYTLTKQVEAIEDWVISIRRQFHQHPELGMEEYWTSQKIAELLRKMAIPHQTGIAGTGIVGIIEGAQPGKTVALRADMDALPIQETTGLAYSSLYPGKMHACGHDAHLAILLGAAKILNGLKDQFQGNIKLFFQPAEETVGGAKLMIKAGCMENPHVDSVLGLHVTPDAKAGQILIKPGKISASSDSIKIIVSGRASHGAYPESGTDAIVITAQVITALQSIISRNISPLDSGVVTLGTVNGGQRENIIADRVVLSGTMRTLDLTTRNLVKQKIIALAKGISECMGGSCEVQFGEGYPPVINDDRVLDIVAANSRELLGKENVLIKEHPSMGVEDFSYFSAYTPGAFYYLGCYDPKLGMAIPGHSPNFQIDERCLKTGVLLQVTNALALLNNL